MSRVRWVEQGYYLNLENSMFIPFCYVLPKWNIGLGMRT